MYLYKKKNNLNLSIILMLILSGVKSELAIANNLKGAPAINSNGSTKMPYEFKAQNNTKSVKRVRIPLNIIPYKKVVLQNQFGQNTTKYVRNTLITQTLRSRVDRPNHFYIQDFHIETHPQKFNNVTKQYDVRIIINKMYGANNQLEEQLGFLDLSGQLQGNGDIYNLAATATKKFKDKSGNPIVEFKIDWPKEMKETIPAISQQEKNQNPNKLPATQQSSNSNLKPKPTPKTPQGWGKG